MRMTRFFRLVATAAVLALAACDTGETMPSTDEARVSDQVPAQRNAPSTSPATSSLTPDTTGANADSLLPLARILEIVRARAPGEVLEVDLDDDDDDGPTYEITILTPDGRVIEAVIDARDGAVLELEED